MSILTETANIIIKGYFEQYPAELEKLKNSETEKSFQGCLYDIEDAIKNELNNKYEFSDLLTLFLSGADEGLNNDFSEWVDVFSPDSSDILTFIKEPETLLYLLLCDRIDSCTIADVLTEVYEIEAPKPPKPTDAQIVQYINNFCLVHKGISTSDILRVLGGAKNE